MKFTLKMRFTNLSKVKALATEIILLKYKRKSLKAGKSTEI